MGAERPCTLSWPTWKHVEAWGWKTEVLPYVHDPYPRGEVVLGCQLEEMLHPAVVCFAFLQLILKPLSPEALTERKAGVHGFPRSPCPFLHLAFA